MILQDANNYEQWENLDVDSLVRSLNQIAEKENDKIIAHVDKLYDKTLTLASPRLMKESNLDFTHQGALPRTLNRPAVSLPKSSQHLLLLVLALKKSHGQMHPYASMTWLHKLRK